MKVTRTRKVAAPVGAVWDLVSDPHSLPRWWPKVMRVEDVTGRGQRSRWTAVLETDTGNGVRADFRCTASTEEERYAWSQDLAGTAFERILTQAGLEIKLEPAGPDGDEREHDLGGDASRPLSPGRADDAGRHAPPARRSVRGNRARARGRARHVSAAESGGPMKWWGWGEPEKRNELADAAKAMLRAELGAAEPIDPVAIESIRLPAAQEIPQAVRGAVGADAVLEGDEDRLLRSGGKSYPDLVRARTDAVETAPDAVVLPAERRRGRGRPRSLCGRGRRRCPVRRRHQRRRRSRCGRGATTAP